MTIDARQKVPTHFRQKINSNMTFQEKGQGVRNRKQMQNKGRAKAHFTRIAERRNGSLHRTRLGRKVRWPRLVLRVDGLDCEERYAPGQEDVQQF